MDFSLIDQAGVIEALDMLRDRGARIASVPYGEGKAYVVLGYDAVERALANEADLPASTYFRTFTLPLMGEVISAQIGEEHRFHRGVFQRPLMAGRIRQKVESVLRPVANRLIDAFAPDLEVDFVSRFAIPYPFDVISAMLGIPERDWEQVRRDVGLLFHIWDPQCEAARDRVAAYLRELIAQRRYDPGEDIISEFARTELHGRRMTDAELLDEVRFLYPAAGGNTQNALAIALGYVLADPELHRRVQYDADARQAAVDEALRIETPIPFMIRYTDRPVRIEGVDIPADNFVLIAISSANRDPERFNAPGDFRLDRGALKHITFGRGPHTCLGAHLARAELRVMLYLILARLPGLRLGEDGFHGGVGGPLHGPQVLQIGFDAILPGLS